MLVAFPLEGEKISNQKKILQNLPPTPSQTTQDFARNKKLVLARKGVQYVAQYPDGTSIRTRKTKTQFLRHPFQLSVNEVFRMKDEHLSFKMKVLVS